MSLFRWRCEKCEEIADPQFHVCGGLPAPSPEPPSQPGEPLALCPVCGGLSAIDKTYPCRPCGSRGVLRATSRPLPLAAPSEPPTLLAMHQAYNKLTVPAAVRSEEPEAPWEDARAEIHRLALGWLKRVRSSEFYEQTQDAIEVLDRIRSLSATSRRLAARPRDKEPSE